MKKFIAAFLTLSMVLSFAACGGTAPASSGSAATESAPASTSNTESANPTYVIEYSHVQAESTPTHRAMLFMKEYLEEHTNGDMTMEIYPSGMLYNDSTEIDAISAGNIDMVSTNVPKLTSLDPGMEFSNAPYLFDSTDQMLAFYNDPEVQSKIFTKLYEVGVTPLAGLYNGYHLYFSGKKVIDTPESWKGLNVRDSGGNMVQEMYKVLGASVVSVSYNDLYSAMDTGLVDFVNTSLDGVTGISMQDILAYGINLDQQQAPYLIQVNTKFLESLPAEYQQILREAALAASDYEWKICQDERDGEIAKIEAAGCEVVEATKEQKDAFKKYWDPITEEFVNDTWKNAVSEFKANYKG